MIDMGGLITAKQWALVEVLVGLYDRARAAIETLVPCRVRPIEKMTAVERETMAFEHLAFSTNSTIGALR